MERSEVLRGGRRERKRERRLYTLVTGKLESFWQCWQDPLVATHHSTSIWNVQNQTGLLIASSALIENVWATR